MKVTPLSCFAFHAFPPPTVFSFPVVAKLRTFRATRRDRGSAKDHDSSARKAFLCPYRLHRLSCSDPRRKDTAVLRFPSFCRCSNAFPGFRRFEVRRSVTLRPRGVVAIGSSQRRLYPTIDLTVSRAAVATARPLEKMRAVNDSSMRPRAHSLPFLLARTT